MSVDYHDLIMNSDALPDDFFENIILTEIEYQTVQDDDIKARLNRLYSIAVEYYVSTFRTKKAEYYMQKIQMLMLAEGFLNISKNRNRSELCETDEVDISDMISDINTKIHQLELKCNTAFAIISNDFHIQKCSLSQHLREKKLNKAFITYSDKGYLFEAKKKSNAERRNTFRTSVPLDYINKFISSCINEKISVVDMFCKDINAKLDDIYTKKKEEYKKLELKETELDLFMNYERNETASISLKLMYDGLLIDFESKLSQIKFVIAEQIIRDIVEKHTEGICKVKIIQDIVKELLGILKLEYYK